ncbi:MAG: hypothetical protein SchgKO_08210 [Schleiferiaceae bacterium]
MQDGLPVSTINAIAQDPNGFLWLATEGGGVVVFDGNSLEVKDLNLPSPFVSSLFIEGDSLWIGTEKGLVLRVMSSEKPGTDTLYSDLGRVHFIERKDGALWIGSRTGLYRKQGSKVNRLQPIEDVYDFEIVGGDHWTASRMGLYKTEDFNEFTQVSSLPHRTLTQTETQGLLTSDPDKVYSLTNSNFQEIRARDVRSVVESEGQILLGSYYQGLFVFDAEGVSNFSLANGLSDAKIRVVFADAQGTVWLGGLASFTRWTEPELSLFTQSDGLPESEVWSVYTGTKTWLGLSQGIVNGFETYSQAQFAEAYTGIVLGMTEWKGRLYLATESGLWMQKSNGELEPVGPSMGLPIDFVFSVCTYNNQLVVATGSGLFITQAGRFRYLEMEESIITQVLSNSQKLFIVTANNGLFVYDNGDIENYPLKDIPLDSTTITHVAVSESGLYVGTSSKGLYLFEKGNVQNLSPETGLNSSLVWSVVAVDSNQVWVGTEKGVQAILKENGIWKTQSVVGGQESEITLECNVGAVSYDEKNRIIYWGTTTGLAQIELSKHPFAERVIPVQITRMDLFFNAETDWSEFAEPNEAWSYVPKKLNLPYDQNYLRFRFVRPLASSEVEYRYRLIGQDASWTYAGASREAVFTNISSGKYTFSVQSRGIHEDWPQEQTLYSFVIQPPFWFTWWFITAFVTLLVGSTLLFIQYRIKRAQHKLDLENQMMELERKALRLQMNPHFVFNALDAISGFIFKNEPQSAVKYLNSFAKLMRLTLETSREHYIPLQSEVSLLTHYLELEALRFKGKFTYELSVSDDLDEYEISIPPMLIQPHIENAILHGLRPKETEDGLVTVNFEPVNEDTLQCVITDNGIGREKAKEKAVRETGKKSLATEITQERIALMNKGNTHKLSFDVLDLKDDSGEAIGTQVILIIPIEEDF